MSKITQHKVGVVYDEYGEILKTIIIKDDEDVEIINKKRKLTESQIQYIKNRSDLHKHSNLLGGYIHMAYVKNELLFNDIGIDRSNISRLIYLATYIDYNNRDCNALVKYSKNKKITYMNKKDIKKVLKLSNTPFDTFMANMKENNLLFEKDGRFYISQEYFSKGEHIYNRSDYTRIYIDTARFLYENSKPRQHKQLSYIYQLVPFMNHELNIICSNPNESDFYKLNKMGLKDICNVLGVSKDKKSMNRLENDLLKFNVIVDGEIYYIFKRVIVKGANGRFDYFVINPYIVWSGKNIDTIKDTIQSLFFRRNSKLAF